MIHSTALELIATSLHAWVGLIWVTSQAEPFPYKIPISYAQIDNNKSPMLLENSIKIEASKTGCYKLYSIIDFYGFPVLYVFNQWLPQLYLTICNDKG